MKKDTIGIILALLLILFLIVYTWAVVCAFGYLSCLVTGTPFSWIVWSCVWLALTAIWLFIQMVSKPKEK